MTARLSMIPLPKIPSAAGIRRSRPPPALVPDAAKTAALKPAIIKAISTVFDPEIPVNIWELGLIYDISWMPTASPACG